jgi:hypothetical protein
MDAEVDIEDLPPKTLRKMLRALMLKAKGKPSKEGADEADEERQKLADLHAEKKGKPPEIPVEKDDLPFETDDDEEDDEEDSESESETDGLPFKKKKKGK